MALFQHARRHFVEVLSVTIVFSFGTIGPVSASSNPISPVTEIAQFENDVSDQDILEAIEQAFDGSAADLARLLENPTVRPRVQELLAPRIQEAEANGLPDRSDVRSQGGRATEIVPQQSGTGKYEYFCTSYTGVTMGWNGKIIRACHGWMNVYISGKHVARYCPDLIPDPPDGGRVTVMCVLNTAATIVTIFTPAGTIGTVAAKTFTSAVGIVGVNMECRK